MGIFSAFAADKSFIELVKSSQARKSDAAKRLRFYQDRQADEILKLIAQRWARPAEFRIFTLNLVKKVINRRATVYRLPPVRHAEGVAQDVVDRLYRDMAANLVLKSASRLVKLHKVVALQVGWLNERPTLSVVTPNILDVVCDGAPEALTRVIVTHAGTSETETTYSEWTATTYSRRDWRGHKVPLPGNERGVNPYGVLPFVPCWDRWPDDEFFIPGGADLIETQEAVNVGLVNLWRAVELQAHGQPWASGVPDAHEMLTGPDRAISLPKEGKFGFAAPNAPIAEILQAIEFVLRQTAATNDLGADVFDLEKRAESGAAKQAERADLAEARADDLELWRRYEDRLFEVMKAVVNTHRPGTIPESAEIRVDFAESASALSEAERLDNAQRRIDLGIWSEVDALLADNPDLGTREDALAELQRRRDERTMLGAGGFPGPSIEGTP